MCTLSALTASTTFKNKIIMVPILVQAICFSVGTKAQQDYFISNEKAINISGFNKEVKKMMDDIGIPGVSLAIIENGKVVFYNTYGYKQADKANRVNKRTVFEGCSLSKSYLVYVAFKLVDEGKLDLDKPMYQYMEYERLKHDPRYKLITPRMILSHSSGIENWQYMNNSDTLEIIRDPGTSYIYSGEGYNYLAKVIELVLKKPYEQYISELLSKPLHLKHSYVRFKKKNFLLFHKEIPGNYATGHDGFGKEYKKWKNQEPVPSSGNNLTALAYAKLMLATFDNKHLSSKSINTILTPVVSTATNFPSYYGTGYEIYYTGNDTIVGHGGDNLGYRAQAFYSIPGKRGFVFLTNSERGKLLTNRLSEITAGLEISRYYEEHFPFEYPGNAVKLFKIYREAGVDVMFAEIENFRNQANLGKNTLTELAGDFLFHDWNIAIRLLEESIKLYPDIATSYGFLGEAYLKSDEYDQALKNYVKAKELHFKWWDTEPKLKECEEKINEAARRAKFLVTITDKGESTIEVEDYNTMHGITEFGPADDGGEKPFVVHMFSGNWMDYKVQVAASGIYTLSIRVSTIKAGSQLEVLCGSTLVTKIEIPSTQSWFNWSTITTKIYLEAGSHTLRLNEAGGDLGFGINWIKFSPVKEVASPNLKTP